MLKQNIITTIFSLTSAIIIAIISIELSESAKYVYEKNKDRSKYRVDKPWEAVGFAPSAKPFVPYRHFINNPVHLIDIPGPECRSYPKMERGRFYNAADNNKVQFRYGWKKYHKNCDIRKFLVCRTRNGKSNCNCMPGMFWHWNADEKSGTCLSSLGKNCTSVKGFNFRFYRTCGDSVRCARNPEWKAGDYTHAPQICQCKHKNAVAKNDTIPMDRDDFGNLRILCKHRDHPSYQVPKIYTGACNEYGVIVNGKMVTKTSCGDVPGAGENMKCKFPSNETGPAIVNGTIRVRYGARTGGNCTCTDDKLSYSTMDPKGCYIPFGSPCEFRGFKCNSTQGLMCDKATNACTCESEMIRSKEGFCSRPPNYVTSIGGRCNETAACDEDYGLVCARNKTCICKSESGFIQGGDVCRGPYGSRCASEANCLGESYECAKIPELRQIYDPRGSLFNSFKNKSYCVCDPNVDPLGFVRGNYFVNGSQTCGANQLTTHSSIIILLISLVYSVHELLLLER